MENQLPPEIAELIEKALQERAAARAERAAKNEQERSKAEAQGMLMVEAHYQDILTKVPEWIHKYHNPQQGDLDFERIGGGNYSTHDIPLVFEIPGLSRIMFSVSRSKTWLWYCEILSWGDVHPKLSFYNAPAYDGLIDAMVQAREQYQNFEVSDAEHKKNVEKQVKDQEAWDAMQRETVERHEAMKAERAAADLSEEQALLNVLKNDPVALAMLKAFVHLQQEREGFEAELESTNNSLYSMEEGWSRKAAELRNRAQEAERRADEERRRLEDELDDERRKQKKAQGGW